MITGLNTLSWRRPVRRRSSRQRDYPTPRVAIIATGTMTMRIRSAASVPVGIDRAAGTAVDFTGCGHAPAASRSHAHLAASATTASVSPASRAATGCNVGSPELPMAISTLRTKRLRPMRLIGDPLNRVRKPASSRAASSARRGAVRSARARSLSCGVALGESVPRADGEAVVAAVDAIAHQRAELARDRTHDARW